jgi:Tfp pilus assembly protein PilE
MAFCASCGKELAAGEAFCSKCGSRQAASGASSGAAGGDDLAVFVGSKDAEKYLAKFRKFSVNGQDVFAATWHWPAFLFGFFWFLYRKMYLWSLLAFFLGMIPYVNFGAAIFFGIRGNYMYYQHAKKKLASLQATLPPSGAQRTAMIAKKGGVNVVAIVLPVLLFVIAILAAIAIPQFAAYRQKAMDFKARAELQDACTRGASLFASDPGLRQITPEDLTSTGFTPSQDVELDLLDGARETFSMSARHVRGTKVYTTDAQCSVTEESVVGR